MCADCSRAPIRGVKSVFNLSQHQDWFVCPEFLLLENKIKMRLPLRTLVVSIPFFLLTFALSAQLKQAVPPATPILGFSPPHAATEHALESTFQSIPSAE